MTDNANYNHFRGEDPPLQISGKALQGEEVIISVAGKPVVKLVPYDPESTPRKLGAGNWRGHIWIAEDFDHPLDLT